MSSNTLPRNPNLQQYKKQAKELLKQVRANDTAVLARVRAHVPAGVLTLTDAQLVLAREHGFASWPRFVAEVDRLRALHAVSVDGAASAFLVAACVPVGGAWHHSGTLDAAEMILHDHPEVAKASIYAAAVLGEADAVRAWLARDAALANAKGGPHGWDALTYLCFSKYLKAKRTGDFADAARALLEAGADAKTGWWETETGEERNFWESAIYGAAAIASHVPLTKLLLVYGADPNDEETPYHVPENYDTGILQALLASNKFTAGSLATVLLRCADTHNGEGMRLALESGADPNRPTRRGGATPFYHSLLRDNDLPMVEGMLNAGGDITIFGPHGLSGAMVAAARGRGDVLRLLQQRGIDPKLQGAFTLIAACATAGEKHDLQVMPKEWLQQVLAFGGTLLAQFAGNGNAKGIAMLLALGVPVNALYVEGDSYFGTSRNSTALHVAAWRARTDAMRVLIENGADVNARDGDGRTALQLAVKAATDSYWKDRRTPEGIRMLLHAGASRDGVALPTGYEEADQLLCDLQ